MPSSRDPFSLLVFPFLALTVRGWTHCLWSCCSKVWGFSELPCRTRSNVPEEGYSVRSFSGHQVSRHSILPTNTDTLCSLISVCFLVCSQQQQCTLEVTSLGKDVRTWQGEKIQETRAHVLALTPVCSLWTAHRPTFLSLSL